MRRISWVLNAPSSSRLPAACVWGSPGRFRRQLGQVVAIGMVRRQIRLAWGRVCRVQAFKLKASRGSQIRHIKSDSREAVLSKNGDQIGQYGGPNTVNMGVSGLYLTNNQHYHEICWLLLVSLLKNTPKIRFKCGLMRLIYKTFFKYYFYIPYA